MKNSQEDTDFLKKFFTFYEVSFKASDKYEELLYENGTINEVINFIDSEDEDIIISATNFLCILGENHTNNNYPLFKLFNLQKLYSLFNTTISGPIKKNIITILAILSMDSKNKF
jgi:hypothetical protein